MESVAIALPVLVLVMALEYYISKKKGKNYFKFADTLSNLSIGALDRISSVLFAGFFYFFYSTVQQKFGLFDIKPEWYSWLTLFFLVDFLWYWYHRASHEISLFWTVHVVHHSSSEFNFTVGTRITIFQSLVRLLFWSLLPLIGFPAPMILLILLIQGVYPFFTHTRIVGKLGFLEKILVTPSNHRVHHGRNEEYMDKNYGGVLIIWDRLFGTYAGEEVEVEYGLSKPLHTKSLLWTLFHFWVELYYMVKKEPNWTGKIRILFSKPDVVDPDLRKKLEAKFLSGSSGERLDPDIKVYATAQMVLVAMATILLVYFSERIDLPTTWLTSAILVVSLINIGALLERKYWAFGLEYARFILVLLSIAVHFPGVEFWAFIGVMWVLSLIYFSKIRRRYIHWHAGTANLDAERMKVSK